jgi:hypothetical protein
LGIVELVDVCERQSARNDELFRTLGAWVADEPDPSRQRWFATAAHRHAWHAELWRQRRPQIPVDAAVEESSPIDVEPDDRSAWYRSQLASLLDELAALRDRVDGVLDPSTCRVIDLVTNDVQSVSDTT